MQMEAITAPLREVSQEILLKYISKLGSEGSSLYLRELKLLSTDSNEGA